MLFICVAAFLASQLRNPLRIIRLYSNKTRYIPIALLKAGATCERCLLAASPFVRSSIFSPFSAGTGLIQVDPPSLAVIFEVNYMGEDGGFRRILVEVPEALMFDLRHIVEQ